MNHGFGILSAWNIQWVIIAITVLFGLIDLQTQKIPNLFNLLLFALLLMAGVPLGLDNLTMWLLNLLVVTIASYFLYAFGALGGGDCKYLMALSPVMKWELLLQVLVMSMLIFIIAYGLKSVCSCLSALYRGETPVFVRGKMPFMWTFIPSLVVMTWI